MNPLDFETAREAQNYQDYSERIFGELEQLLELYRKCDDRRTERIKFAILNKAAEYAQVGTALKVRKIREALENPGKHPKHHMSTLKTVREGWPTLFNAIEETVYGQNYVQQREIEEKLKG